MTILPIMRSLAVTLALGASTQGCKKPPELAPNAPPVKVNLPPSPPMDEPQFVEKYVDGCYTVAGLVQGRAKLFGHEVKVKGYVQSVHRCDEALEECDPPSHAVLVDDLARPRKRLVVTCPAPEALASLQQGEGVTLEGRYLQSDPRGLFVRMEGVLVLPVPPEPPPPAADSPDSGPTVE